MAKMWDVLTKFLTVCVFPFLLLLANSTSNIITAQTKLTVQLENLADQVRELKTSTVNKEVQAINDQNTRERIQKLEVIGKR